MDSAWHLVVCFPWLQFSRLSEEKNCITTMAAAAKNGPLLPHMSSNFGSILVGLTGNNAPSKRIFFFAMRGSIALRTLRWQGDDSNESCIVIDRPPYCKKKISAWSGHHSSLIRQVCAWHWSSCAAMGGHFRRRRPWWWGVSLTVGRGAYVTTNPTSRNSRNSLMVMNLVLSSDGRTCSLLMGLHFWGLNAA